MGVTSLFLRNPHPENGVFIFEPGKFEVCMKKYKNLILRTLILFSYPCACFSTNETQETRFKLIWDPIEHQGYKFSEEIESKYFEGEDFGPEGNIDDQFDWERETISYSELKARLVRTAQSINPIRSKSWIEASMIDLLDQVLGSQEQYNISDSLNDLRALDRHEKSTGHKLVQRILALSSFDGLKKGLRERFNQIYKDLNITDIDILPECKYSEASNLISICLYQDNCRKIRLHYIFPFATHCKAEFPHTHYGPSASIILAGSLVNQFFSVFPKSKEDKDADFALYSAVKGGFADKLRRASVRFLFETNIQLGLISSHLYKSGDHYFLPAPRREVEHFSINDFITFHRIGTQDFAVTLFSQSIEGTLAHATFPLESPEIFYREYETTNVMPDQEALRLAHYIDEKVREAM